MAKKPPARGESAESILARDLNEGARGVKRLYLFGGSEPYLRDRAIEKLRHTLLDGAEEFNLTVLEGKNLTAESVAEAIDTLPVFHDRRLVLVRSFDPLRPPAEEKAAFRALLSDLPDYICLVFELPPADKGGTRDKELSALVKEAGRELLFERPSDDELIGLVTGLIFEAGRDMNPADAAEVVRLCAGSDLYKLVNETGKLARGGEGRRVTREEIARVIAPSPDAVAYRLTDALLAGQGGRALSLFRLLVGRGEEPLGLLALLSRNFRQYYAVKLARAAGLNAVDMADEAGVSEKAAAVIARNVAPLDLAALRRTVLRCAEAEYECKSSGGDAALIVEFFMLRAAEELSR